MFVQELLWKFGVVNLGDETQTLQSVTIKLYDFFEQNVIRKSLKLS